MESSDNERHEMERGMLLIFSFAMCIKCRWCLSGNSCFDSAAWVTWRACSLLKSPAPDPASTGVRPHSHWHEYQLRVIHTSETCTSGAFTVTRTSTNTCNSDAIKNLVKIVKYLVFLTKVYSNIANNVVPNCLRQNYVISLLCAV